MYAACELPPGGRVFFAKPPISFRARYAAAASMQLLLYGVRRCLSIHFLQNFYKKPEKPPNFALYAQNLTVFLKNPSKSFRILPKAARESRRKICRRSACRQRQCPAHRQKTDALFDGDGRHRQRRKIEIGL